MGGNISVLNKPYGQSLFGNIYKTKVPVEISFSDSEKPKFYISEWRDSQSLLNPKVGHFEIKLDPGLIFIVTNVMMNVGIDSAN